MTTLLAGSASLPLLSGSSPRLLSDFSVLSVAQAGLKPPPSNFVKWHMRRLGCFLSLLYFFFSLNVLSIIVLLENNASLPTSSSKRQGLVMGLNGSRLPVPVAAMTNLRLPDILTDHIGNHTVVVADGVSGCEPKFFLTTASQSFIFKPSRRGNAMNELIAFHVDRLYGFNRVPPVWVHEIGLDAIDLALSRKLNSTSLLSCTMDFQAARSRWILHNQSKEVPRMIGTRQVLLPSVRQRTEIDRFVNKHVASGHLQMPPSIFGEREIGTRSLFDSLIGNWDRFNNDFSMHQLAGGPLGEVEVAANLLVYIDNNGLSTKTPIELQFCRFYYEIVERVRSTVDPRKEVLSHILTSAPLVKQLIESKTINAFSDLRPLNYMNRRRRAVLAQIEDCIQKHGFDHVFVAQ